MAQIPNYGLIIPFSYRHKGKCANYFHSGVALWVAVTATDSTRNERPDRSRGRLEVQGADSQSRAGSKTGDLQKINRIHFVVSGPRPAPPTPQTNNATQLVFSNKPGDHQSHLCSSGIKASQLGQTPCTRLTSKRFLGKMKGSQTGKGKSA